MTPEAAAQEDVLKVSVEEVRIPFAAFDARAVVKYLRQSVGR